MNTLVLSETHRPCSIEGVLGLSGYESLDSLICFTANGDNNFLSEGIVEKSILFVDQSKEYREGLLNVYHRKNAFPPFKLSRTPIEDADYFGRIILTINPYQE